MPEQYYCKKCNRTMGADQFYGSNNLEKYPNGKLDTCKKCITMHVDNFNPDTYMWILQECDVPYVPDEWHKLLEKYAYNRDKLTGMTILGRYLSKMKLKQHKDYRWKDTAFLQEMADTKKEQAMKRQGYDAQEIALQLEKDRQYLPEDGVAKEPVYDETPSAPQPVEDYFAEQCEGEELNIDLTDEDKTYLRLKWGKTYKPEEWVKLEQLYEEMMQSYDIQGAGHIDTLKLICKTSLKANQLIDMGDIEGFQKMSKVYDSLMKSGNFTAAQNKSESGEFVDSIGELIELCEKDGYIERYYVESPNDKVDLTLQDMQRYTRTLIEEETNISTMVEKALRENAKEDEEDAKNNESDIIDEADLSIEDLEKTLRDEDYTDFEDFKDELAQEDAKFLESL